MSNSKGHPTKINREKRQLIKVTTSTEDLCVSIALFYYSQQDYLSLPLFNFLRKASTYSAEVFNSSGEVPSRALLTMDRP